MDETRLKNLSHEIQTILTEIQSEKVANRNKSMDRLNTILSDQKCDIIKILRNSHCYQLKWSGFYADVMDSIMKHSNKLEESQNLKSFQTMTNRNLIYWAVINKIIDYGFEGKISFPVDIIMERFFLSFDSSCILKHFGTLLLKILDNTIFRNKITFSKLKIQDFSRLISYLFENLKTDNNSSLNLQILKCLNKSIEFGSDNLQISYELSKFLINIKELCDLTSSSSLSTTTSLFSEEHYKNEIIKLIFLFIQNITIDFHRSACQLIQNVFSQILTFYDFLMKNDVKEIFFDLCYLSLILHYPKINLGDISMYFEETDEWNKILRKMFSIVQNEITKTNSLGLGKSNKILVSKKFIKLTSALSYLIFWKKILQNTISDYTRKKFKKNEQIYAIIDLIEEINGIPNWIWFCVLNELLLNYSIKIDFTEYKNIQNLISYSIDQIKFPYQVEIVKNCCKILLEFEHNNNTDTDTNIEFNQKFWEKIWNLSAANDTNNKDDLLIYEKYKFLQILLKDKRISTQNLIINFLQCIISKPIRNEIILKTLCVLLKYHGNTLYKCKNLNKDIILWLHSNNNNNNNTITSEQFDKNIDVIMEISVLLVTKIKFENISMDCINNKIKLKKYDCEEEMNEIDNVHIIRDYLSFKYLEKLLCIEWTMKNNTKNNNYAEMQTINNNKSISIIALNDMDFDILLKTMKLDTTTTTTTYDCNNENNIINEIENLIDNVKKLENCIILMDKFLQMQITNYEKQLQLLTKRISFILNSIDIQMQNLNKNEFNFDNLKMFMHKMKIIFKIFNKYPNHNLFIEVNVSNIIKFIGLYTDKLKIRRQFNEDIHQSEDIKNLINNAIKILVYQNCNYNNNNRNDLNMKQQQIDTWNYIKNYYETNSIENLNDIENLFNLYKIYYRCTPNQCIANWMIDNLKEICSEYHNDKDVSEIIVSNLPDILNYIKGETNLLDDICIIISSFLKKCYRNCYSVTLTCNILLSIKDFIQIYPNILKCNEFIEIIVSINKFLYIKSIKIQLNTIKLLYYLINSNISFHNGTIIIPEEYFYFCNEFYKQFMSNKIVGNEKSMEVLANNNCIKIQLWICIMIACPVLRENCFLDLSEFCTKTPTVCKNLINNKICSNYVEYKRIITEDLIELMSFNLLKNDPKLDRISWFLCDADEKNFYTENFAILSFCLLKISLEHFHKLKSKINKEINEIYEETIPICYAFLLPYLCKMNIETLNNFTEYSLYAKKLVSNLKSFIDNEQIKIITKNNLWKVLYNIFEYVWDGNKFKNNFGFNLSYKNKRLLNLNCKMLKNCLEYFLTSHLSCEHNYFENLLKTQSFQIIKVSAAIKMKYENSTSTEDKLLELFRYCCLLEFIWESLSIEFCNNSYNQKKIRDFFIKDVITFFGTILKNDNSSSVSLKSASLHYLHKFCTGIIELHSDSFGKHLKFLIQRICNLIERNSSNEILMKLSHNLLNLLIYESEQYLGEFLKNLDEFPNIDNFLEYKNFINDKYKSQYAPNINLKYDFEEFITCPNRNWNEYKILYENISKRKSDLVALCKDIPPLNCDKHLLHQIIISLLDTIKNNEKSNITLMASKCLGEIGPINLRTIALNCTSDMIIYKNTKNSQESFDYFISCTAKIISNLIFSENQRVCALSNDVCHIIIGNTETGICIINNYEYLYPFACANDKMEENIRMKIVRNDLNLIQVLNDSKGYSYDEWIKYFVMNIYDYFGWYHFKNLSSVEVSFCEVTIVPLIKILLSQNNQEIMSCLENAIDYFFTEVINSIKDLNNKKSSTVYTRKFVVKIFLNITECIRIYKQNYNQEFKINCLLHVSKAAVYCEAYFLAILYLELWALQEKNKNSTIKKEQLMENQIFQEVARESYKLIGINEAMEGFLNPITSRIEYLCSQNKWTDILIELDAVNDHNSNQLQLNELKRNGLFSLTSHIEKDNNDEIDYETYWRLGDWDKLDENLIVMNEYNNHENIIISDKNIEFNHYHALESINKKNYDLVIESIDKGRKCIIKILKNISTECTAIVYKYLSWLQLFQQIEDFCQIQFLTNTTANELLYKWNEQDKILFDNNSYKEVTISQKICLIKNAGIRAERKINECFKEQNIIGEYMLRAIKTCNESDKYNLALRHIACLRQMETDNEIKVRALIEDAKMNWNLSNIELSKSILHHIVTSEKYAFCTNKVNALRIYGEFLAETNSESFDILHAKFFDNVFTLLNNFSKNQEHLIKLQPNNKNLIELDRFSSDCRKDNYHSIAKYADREYIQLVSYMNSDAFKTKIKLSEMNKETFNREKMNNIIDYDKKLTLSIMNKNIGIDDNEIKLIETKKTEYLCLAIRNYVDCCKLEDNMKTTIIYRILALWFSNKSNSKLSNEIEEYIHTIPSYKFICVLDQIIARLGNSNENFLNIIKKILVKCTKEHPHHTLPKLLALRNANADGNKKSSVNDGRFVAVKQIIDELESNEYSYKCMEQLQTVFIALIEFSNKEFTDKEKRAKIKNFTISDNLKKLNNLEYVHCLTIELPISLNRDYSNIKSIVKWENNFSFVGGINAPKRLKCLCSDGIVRSELLKGKDDLRQDAIMMQALKIVNDLLNANKKEHLNIRTYKVVPLSKRSGILEWCENTIPLGIYLSGPDKMSGAHKKYRPKDLMTAECRRMMNDVLKNSFEDKLKKFKEICNGFKPVFHNFFFENFLIPGVWFQKRLSYINSVATTSIVGYILGLGDRHAQNILIDKRTAEVIHIDYGIAFEQGKIMPTPETIPFRLTRDIVAPMGICEVDGIFRKCCEQVMSVLRKNQSVIITILEVLLYDPLYNWILNSKMIMKSQNVKLNMSSDDVEEKNTTAERALLRVKSKLDGMEEAGIGMASVDVQVQRLIKQAINQKNLCKLYPGWEPYL